MERSDLIELVALPSRFVLVLAFAGGAACGSDQACDVSVLAAERIDGVAAIDCGSLVAEGEVHPNLEEAHECVEGALDAASSFLVIWTYHGFEGDVSSAYVGRVEDERLIIDQYDRGPDGTGNVWTSHRECSQLTPMSTCDPSLLRGFLCFECEDPSAPDVICRLES